MSNSMFFTGLSGLNAAQAALVTTGHNTANVNTAGYSRQSAQIASGGGVYSPGVGFFGSGAKVTDVTRSYDQYLTSQFNQAQSTNQSLSTYYTQISQIDNLLANQTAGLAPQMQQLFTHVQAVVNAPADPAARQQLISSSQAMANQFRSMDQYLTGLNANVNDQVAGSVDQINTYAEQIASLNKQVAMFSNAAGGQAPNDLLDQRDQLVNDLGKIVGTKLVVQDGGQYNVFIGNGQTLVLGDKATKLAAINSASDPSRTTIATVNAAGQKIEVQESMIAGGSLGGLLQFRSETLTTAQNSLGRIAIALADSFNAQQHLGVDLNGAVGGDFFSQASPGVISNSRNTGPGVSASLADSSQLTLSDYRLDVGAGSVLTVTRLSDNQVLTPVGGNIYDGIKLDFGAAVPVAGDSFLIQPTKTGARDLTAVLTDPAKVAAAMPIVTGNATSNRGGGVISAGTVSAAYLAPASTLSLRYDSGTNQISGFPTGVSVTVTLANGTADPASPYTGGTVPYSPGASMTFNGITVAISGTPSNGDSFTIDKNTSGVSDGRNALLMGALQNKKIMGNGTASFSDAYGQLVSTVGNKARQVQIANTAQTSLTAQIRSAQQSMSGVNQDEETANLLMFQQMYQANAKVIQTASSMFDAVLGIR
jgi:flagellar hook-associated protein 1